MDLSIYNFPEVTKVDLAFPTFDTIPELLEEAEKRHPRKGMDKFSQLFFSGGEIKFQDDVKDTWKEKAFMYARALMGSYAPKHEHKTLVVGMIFEEVLVL
jgi:hypothetical protein